MIFRIDGEIGELLALTPIIREWRRRNSNEDVFVETNTPEIFYGNPDVVEAAVSISKIGPYYDMNVVRWREIGVTVESIYADMILGDRNFVNWKPFMTSRSEDIDNANQFKTWNTKGRPIVTVAFSGNMIDSGVADEVVEEVERLGYVVDGLNGFGTWGLARAHIDVADLFIGEDGAAAAIALTTDTPAIICYSYRSPSYFPPFRRDVPFRALVPERSLCENAPVCHSRRARIEFSKFYSQECVAENKFCCKKRSLVEDVKEAIRSMEDRA